GRRGDARPLELLDLRTVRLEIDLLLLVRDAVRETGLHDLEIGRAQRERRQVLRDEEPERVERLLLFGLQLGLGRQGAGGAGDERSRSALRAAIWAAGGEVVGESVRCADALAVVRRAAPDVAICAAGLPDGDGVQTAAQLTAGDCPVVLFTSHTDEALVERAR